MLIFLYSVLSLHPGFPRYLTGKMQDLQNRIPYDLRIRS